MKANHNREERGLTFDVVEQITNRLLKVIAVKAGISKTLTTHVGRHTCATLLLELGYTLEDVAEVLG